MTTLAKFLQQSLANCRDIWKESMKAFLPNYGRSHESQIHENLIFITMVEVTNLKYSGNMLPSERQDNQINHESNTVVDHVPLSGGLFPVTAVDGVVAV
jgi:hypothetical protein